MTKLNSITISNVRRFSENVTLNISAGATIILAPNGTGKTSIFEAIELALTGGVKRLYHPPDALIHDGHSNAKIRLDFDKEQFCEAEFNRGQNPTVNNQHPELFGAVDKKNIPYLLRLTHLLNQNSKDWFVQSTGTDAAQQLDSLAIGKDAQQVYGNITSLKRATTVLLDNLLQDSKSKNDDLTSWEELLDRRNSLTAVSDTGLIPKKDIIGRIHEIKASKDQDELSEDIPAINAYLNEVKLQIDREIATLQARIGRFETHKSTILSYNQIITALTAESSSITEANAKLDAQKLAIDDINKKINDQTKVIEAINAAIAASKTDFSTKVRLEEGLTLLTGLKQNLLSLSEKIGNSTQLKANAQVIFDALSESNRLYKAIEARQSSIILQKAELRLLQQVIENWKLSEDLLQQQQILILEFPERENNMFETIKTAEINLSVAVESRRVLEERLKSLTETADTIKQAVTMIVSNLPKTENTCPVCLNEYESDDLQNRMARAQMAINADIIPLNESLDKAKEEVRLMSDLFDQAHNALVVGQRDFRIVKDKVEELNNIIASYKIKFSAAEDSTSASRELLTKMQSLLSAEEILAKEFNDFVNVPNDEALATAESNLQIRISELHQLDANILSINRQIKEQELVVNELQSINNTEQSRENIERKIFELEKQYRESDAQKKEWLDNLNQAKSLYESLKSRLIDIQSNLQKIDFRKSELISLWQQDQLENEPNSIFLENSLKESEVTLKLTTTHQQALNTITAELAKWQAYEDYFKFEKDIKDRTSGLSEEEFADKLQNEKANAERKLSAAKKNNEILNTFAKFLDLEIQTINTRLQAINPTLSKILGRLTVDPRFAQTNISSYQHYKKNYADIKVPLHNSHALVSHVASEAQITDVQFSLLLAMAQTYQWSPWKALLLDDPTQHHDLVHASSVFDILRDYIVDYGFQIVLATHDAVQAKFFMRKLENDGIPCSLYNLKSTERGVIAEMT